MVWNAVVGKHSVKAKDMFRSAHELPLGLVWLTGALVMLLSRPLFWWMFGSFCVCMALYRWSQARELIGFWIRINGYRAQIISRAQMLALTKQAISKKSLFIGFGAEWEPSHAQQFSDTLQRDSTEMRTPPLWLMEPDQWVQKLVPHLYSSARLGTVLKPLERLAKGLQPDGYVPVKDGAIGLPWMHGLIQKERAMFVPLSSLAGHTAIEGTTRTGKTRFYEVLTFQIIHMGNALVCIDPKGDDDWRARLRKEAKAAGRVFLELDPAHPERSIRLNPLANFASASEPASRVGQLVDADGSFAAFSWKTLFRLIRAEVIAGRRPTIYKLKLLAGSRPAQAGLLEEILVNRFKELDGARYTDGLAAVGGAGAKAALPVDGWIAKFYSDPRFVGLRDEYTETILAMIALYQHPEAHFSKMVQSLEPILEMLGSGDLGKLLSPDLDPSDLRPIWDMKRIIKEKAILYVPLNSLVDGQIGSALGSILSAELASCTGMRYQERDKRSGPIDEVFLFWDEAAEAINPQVIQILNKGGGAGMRAFLAFQTEADLEAKLASTAKARMAMGNLNNLFALRVKDTATVKALEEMFGKCRIYEYSDSLGAGGSSSSSPLDSNKSRGTSRSRKEVSLVHSNIWTSLPPLQMMAFINGKDKVKLRTPLISA
jgi:conjugal transfer pilus assembly protein TraD